MIGILKGLATTFSTFTRRPVTIQYPDEKHELSERQRSFPVLTWDFDHDEPFCTGCNICVRNCPVDCMTAVMHDNPKHPEGTSDRRKIIEKFWIDYARCMRCNICIEVCPFEAITMDNTWEGHEHSAYDRRDLHKDIEDLLEASKSGRLPNPFRPLDNIETNAAVAEGEEPPAIGFAGARPEAQDAQAERIAQGLGAAIQEREPEVQAQAATAAAGATAEDDEVASPLAAQAARTPHEGGARGARRARSGRGERRDDRRPAPLRQRDVHGDHGRARAPHRHAPARSRRGGAPAAAAAPAGDVGDPNSPRKIRARRMKRGAGRARAHREGRGGSGGAPADAERHGERPLQGDHGERPGARGRGSGSGARRRPRCRGGAGRPELAAQAARAPHEGGARRARARREGRAHPRGHRRDHYRARRYRSVRRRQRRGRQRVTTEILWWIFAVAIVAVSAGVVFARTVIHSAIFLILSLAGVGAMYLFLTIEFIALVQFLIYGGAVTVLILLALMLTRMGSRRDGPSRRRACRRHSGHSWRRGLMATLIGVAVATAWPGDTRPERGGRLDREPSVTQMFQHYGAPFMITAALLLVAFIGAIVIARQEDED